MSSMHAYEACLQTKHRCTCSPHAYTNTEIGKLVHFSGESHAIHKVITRDPPAWSLEWIGAAMPRHWVVSGYSPSQTRAQYHRSQLMRIVFQMPRVIGGHAAAVTAVGWGLLVRYYSGTSDSALNLHIDNWSNVCAFVRSIISALTAAHQVADFDHSDLSCSLCLRHDRQYHKE